MAANYKPLTIDSLCHIFPAISRDKIERIMLCTQRHGINRRAISRETGIDVSLVFKVLKKSGVRTLHRHHHLDASVVLRMHGAGATDHQIAEYLRVPGPSVTTKRHRLKLCANVAARWPVLCVGHRQQDGFLEIASERDAHSRYEVICYCPAEPHPHSVGKRVYVGHFNAGSVKSCGKDSPALWANSAYAKERRAAALKSKARRDEIMCGLSFQTCIVLHLCELKLKGFFRMNDRALLEGKEIDLVFPRVGDPKVLVEINERNHDCTTKRKTDCAKRNLAMYKYPDTEWITISEKRFLENPHAEIGGLLVALQRKELYQGEAAKLDGA
jgi:hypothetical protein